MWVNLRHKHTFKFLQKSIQTHTHNLVKPVSLSFFLLKAVMTFCRFILCDLCRKKKCWKSLITISMPYRTLDNGYEHVFRLFLTLLHNMRSWISESNKMQFESCQSQMNRLQLISIPSVTQFLLAFAFLLYVDATFFHIPNTIQCYNLIACMCWSIRLHGKLTCHRIAMLMRHRNKGHWFICLVEMLHWWDFH